MTRRLTDKLARKIAEYQLLETHLEPADICIVFGNRDLEKSAKCAAELYHRGLFPCVVVTGGVRDRASNMIQAEYLAKELVRLGVPEKVIIKENVSTNTGENVQYSMALIENEIGLDNVKSVLAVGRIEASRRYLMTIERHMPGRQLMISPVCRHNVPKELWHTDERFRADVLREFEKLPDYFKKGFIAEINVRSEQFRPKGNDSASKLSRRRRPQPCKPRPYKPS